MLVRLLEIVDAEAASDLDAQCHCASRQHGFEVLYLDHQAGAGWTGQAIRPFRGVDLVVDRTGCRQNGLPGGAAAASNARRASPRGAAFAMSFSNPAAVKRVEGERGQSPHPERKSLQRGSVGLRLVPAPAPRGPRGAAHRRETNPTGPAPAITTSKIIPVRIDAGGRDVSEDPPECYSIPPGRACDAHPDPPDSRSAALDPDTVRRPIVTVGLAFEEVDQIEIASHRHKKGQFLFVQRGALSCEVEGGLWIVPPGSAV